MWKIRRESRRHRLEEGASRRCASAGQGHGLSPAPQALPQAVGLGSAAPQAEDGSAGASPAPQAVPQAEEAVFSPLPLQLNRSFNAIVNSSWFILGIRGSPDPCCQYSGEESPPQVRTFL